MRNGTGSIRGRLLLGAGATLVVLLALVVAAVEFSPRLPMAAACGGIVLLFLLVLAMLSRWILQPVEKVAGEAEEIVEGDLSRRIPRGHADPELDRLGEVLNDTLAQLEQVDGEMRRFTSDASHELRTPLAVMISEAQAALTRERSAEEYRDALAVCLEAAQELRQLSDQLLNVARYDRGGMGAHFEPIDLGELAENCCHRLMPLAEERDIALTCSTSPARVLGDGTRLTQLLTNLLTNGFRYSGAGDKVRVRVGELFPGTVCLEVEDTGCGIAEKDLPHVFDRCFRADLSRTQPEGRTGLGLAICKAIAHLHEGAISVTSSKGEGSTFRVTLPTAPQAHA